MPLYERLAEVERQGGEAALATVVRVRGSVPRQAGSKMIVYPDGRMEGTVGGGEMEGRVIEEAVAAIRDGKPRLLHYTLSDPKQGDPGVCGGEVEVFVEPLRPKPTIIVVGGGHVGNAVAHLARWLGFRVVVCDDRPEFATPQAVPEADAYLTCELKDLPQHVPIDPQTYLVLTTRSVSIDVPGLPALLATPAAYIGVIGSRRRWETSVEELHKAGVSDQDLARVTSPMGLEIHAETPEEIAVSILGEIIRLRRGGSGEPMRHLPHDGKAPV
ncbi:MAG TPA: XdhC family protein [Anaerolineales bacterium]|nr:XdhC family protein [Anaerolineales bacterium]